MQAKLSPQPLRVFKFGGASVKDATGLLNVARILEAESRLPGKIVVVVSAMGKTTNALEALLEKAASGGEYWSQLEELVEKHGQEASEALGDSSFEEDLAALRAQLQASSNAAAGLPFDEAYDQLVSLGELMSSRLLVAVLRRHLPSVALLDARRLIKTDSTFRAPQVAMGLTLPLIRAEVEAVSAQVSVVQGFIGSDDFGRTTTLGREGSDYTAALFGRALTAESVTVWKDVPGVLNADPKRLPTGHLLPRMTYADAAEMTYYGATVLHPKTLKPLAEAGIPLYVRSFLHPTQPGTLISAEVGASAASNVFLYLDKIALLTCRTRDLSFVTEWHVARVMRAAHEVGLRVLVVQNSALELQLVVAQDFTRAGRLAELMEKEYAVEARYDLALWTFLRAEEDFVGEIIQNRPILLRQHSGTAERILTPA